MARIITTICFAFTALFAQAQNVGIGTNSPLSKLHIVSNENGDGILLTNPDSTGRLSLRTTSDGVFIYSNNLKSLNLGAKALPALTIVAYSNPSTGEINQSVGIGTQFPFAKLHVNGNANITSNATIGGNAYIDGDAYISGYTSLQGDLFVSGDIICYSRAFRVSGLAGGVNQVINKNAWTKVMFNTSVDYNYGNSYQPNSHQYLAGVNGLYSFKAQVTYDFGYRNEGFSGIRLMRSRNGITSILMESSKGAPLELAGGVKTINNIIQTLATDVQLKAGDTVWIETYVDYPYEGTTAKTTAPVFGNALHTFFCGYLISKALN